jgi:hypothetical protein
MRARGAAALVVAAPAAVAGMARSGSDFAIT